MLSSVCLFPLFCAVYPSELVLCPLLTGQELPWDWFAYVFGHCVYQPAVGQTEQVAVEHTVQSLTRWFNETFIKRVWIGTVVY